MGRTMVQAVSRQPLTAEARVLARVFPYGILVDEVPVGQVFIRVLWFLPVNIFPAWLSILKFSSVG
jgi:hypothetical protein